MKNKSIAAIIAFSSVFVLSAGAAITNFTTVTTLRIIDNFGVWKGNGSETAITAPPASINLQTTIELDTELLQIRVFGSHSEVFLNSNSSTEVAHTVGYQSNFPNPSTPIYKNGTLDLNMVLQIPSFTFDSGVQPLVFGPGWVFTGPEISFTASISLNQVMSTESIIYSDAGIVAQDFALPTGTWYLNVSNYPNSLSVSSANSIRPVGISYTDYYTAPNGFESNLIIPEPTSLCLLSAGVWMFAARRVRKIAQ